ncbi:MAG TPA: hypothetical protein VNA25_30980 [Phycisphaerae bacterium]|nr:hypothetical protein [Phycisphaerae bacterium]
MSPTATLERPLIEDTLFGDKKVVAMEDTGPEPDGPCFCICGCRDQASKINISQLNSVTISVGTL